MPSSTSTYLTMGKNWLRTTKKAPCPICQRAGYCEVARDNKTVHCMKVASDRPFAHRQGGWLHAHPLYFDLEVTTSTSSRATNRKLSLNSYEASPARQPRLDNRRSQGQNQQLGE